MQLSDVIKVGSEEMDLGYEVWTLEVGAHVGRNEPYQFDGFMSLLNSFDNSYSTFHLLNPTIIHHGHKSWFLQGPTSFSPCIPNSLHHGSCPHVRPRHPPIRKKNNQNRNWNHAFTKNRNSVGSFYSGHGSCHVSRNKEKENGVHGLTDSTEPLPITFLWVALRYLFLGSADLFTLTGMMEFFFTKAPWSMRSLATALSWASLAMGYYSSTVLESAMMDVDSSVDGCSAA
ncbi:hypothetical protein Ahy_B09g100096 [Arachis hypogaea]|uniref:Uncharacterized protein n=1 Tax=Arachis hypogaea TaxID=3818 RepID=A0A444XVR9_ARAHY|nr:hypothetical protein Ahy_B09g100096 [Arachis hypogaea]